MGQCTSHESVNNIDPTDYHSLDYNRYSTYQKLENIATGIVQNQQINTSYSALIQRIIAARQDHILKLLQTMSPDEKGHFIARIEHIDFETVDSLYYHCYQQQQMDIFKSNVVQLNSLPSKEVGYQMIKDRKAGVVFLCGGSNSRLPNKILQDIGLPSRKCILQIMIERLKKVIYQAQEDSEDVTNLKDFPIGILVSDINGYAIKQYLKQKKDFAFPYIHIMQQKSLPIINVHGQLVFQNLEPVMTPDGTGAVFKELYSFIKQFPGMKQIHLIGCDNLVGLPLDPTMLGHEVDVICKVIETNSVQDDKIFFQNGYFKTFEAQDSSMTENPENLMKMCLNDLYISVNFLNTLKMNHEKSLKFSQRYHIIKRNQTIQFEKHIFDIMEVANSVYLHPIEDYALLTDDSKRAVIQLSNVHKRYIKLEGTQDDELVEISPYMSYNGEDLRKLNKATIKFPLIL